MEEEHSTENNNNTNNILSITQTPTSRHLQIRRSILRQTLASRSLPYNARLSSLRRRQETPIRATQIINNSNANIENSVSTDVNTLSIDQDMGIYIQENEFISNNIFIPTNEGNDNDDFEVLVDFSNRTSINFMTENESNPEVHDSYHSLSTVDFESDENENHQIYYTTTSSLAEQAAIRTNHTDIRRNRHENYSNNIDDDHEYYPSINENSNDDEDLSIEIILETSPNNYLSPIQTRSNQRRRSTTSSNIRHSRGLRSVDIMNIPQNRYNSIQEHINEKYSKSTILNTECYICLEEFQPIDLIKILNCQHIFHAECINEWLRSHSNCAYCRTSVLIDDVFQSAVRRRRHRTRIRQNENGTSRLSTTNSTQSIPVEPSTLEQ